MIGQRQSAQQKNYLRLQIRGFISQVINFGINENASADMIKVLLNVNLGKFIQVKLWNLGIQAQIKSFVGKVKLLYKNQNCSAQVLRKNAQHKIVQSCKQFCSIIQKVIEKQNWCMCERAYCPSRFQPQRMIQRAKIYFMDQFIRQTMNLPQPLRFEDCQNFLLIENDMQCCILSIQKAENKNRSKRNQKKKQIKQTIIQKHQAETQFLALQQLKINKDQRMNCYIDGQRLDKLIQRYKQKF